MKVILLKEVKGLAKAFEVKDVSEGYARNFLIPRGLAKAANENSLVDLAFKKDSWHKEETALKTKLDSLALQFGKLDLTFELQTGEHGEIFGSVNKDEIIKKAKEILPDLNQENISLKIDLEKPIKTLGKNQVSGILSGRVTTGSFSKSADFVKTKINLLVSPKP